MVTAIQNMGLWESPWFFHMGPYQISFGLSMLVNACGNPNFSFSALEMRRFQLGSSEILVPKVEGDSRPKVKRTSSTRRHWDRENFFKDAKSKVSSPAITLMEDLFDWIYGQDFH